MKYVVVLPDGVADKPVKELGNKTPLEAARHPNIDWIAREGITGLTHTIPEGFPPGSDVGCMSVFGYDPRKYHTGRAPIEAAAQGIPLKETDVVFRCNTVTIQNGVMTDYSAGHIETPESKQIINTVNEQLGKEGIKFYFGVGYRHLAVVDSNVWHISVDKLKSIQCTPPHDISGKEVGMFLPTGPGSEKLKFIMAGSGDVCEVHPVNIQRQQEGKTPATQVWFWGQGTAVHMPSFKHVYGLKAAVISAVDIVRGIGRLADMEILKVPGITGYFDTNYEGKADYALAALDQGFDLVVIHIESTDEAGHMGDVKKKIMAIEDVDQRVVARVLEGLKKRGEDFAILVVPDHPTSVVLKTHISDPVPFAIYASNAGGPKDNVTAYTESAVRSPTKRFENGFELMAYFLSLGK